MYGCAPKFYPQCIYRGTSHRLLLSHEDIATYQRILHEEIRNEQDILNFFKSRTFDPHEVSPRAMRQAAEIIVLLPDDLHRLDFTRKHMSIVPVQRAQLAMRSYFPGQFHSKQRRIAKMIFGEAKKEGKERKRLIKELKNLSEEHRKLGESKTVDVKAKFSRLKEVEALITQYRQRLFELEVVTSSSTDWSRESVKGEENRKAIEESFASEE